MPATYRANTDCASLCGAMDSVLDFHIYTNVDHPEVVGSSPVGKIIVCLFVCLLVCVCVCVCVCVYVRTYVRT